MTSFTYRIISGNETGAFAISDSGVISVASALDYETTNSYTLKVEVSDGVNPATIDVAINVINIDESTAVPAAAAGGGGGGGGCALHPGAEFDPVLLLWLCLSALYLSRQRPLLNRKSVA